VIFEDDYTGTKVLIFTKSHYVVIFCLAINFLLRELLKYYPFFVLQQEPVLKVTFDWG